MCCRSAQAASKHADRAMHAAGGHLHWWCAGSHAARGLETSSLAASRRDHLHAHCSSRTSPLPACPVPSNRVLWDSRTTHGEPPRPQVRNGQDQGRTRASGQHWSSGSGGGRRRPSRRATSWCVGQHLCKRPLPPCRAGYPPPQGYPPAAVPPPGAWGYAPQQPYGPPPGAAYPPPQQQGYYAPPPPQQQQGFYPQQQGLPARPPGAKPPGFDAYDVEAAQAAAAAGAFAEKTIRSQFIRKVGWGGVHRCLRRSKDGSRGSRSTAGSRGSRNRSALQRPQRPTPLPSPIPCCVQVMLIVFLQLCVTVGVACVFMFVQPVKASRGRETRRAGPRAPACCRAAHHTPSPACLAPTSSWPHPCRTTCAPAAPGSGCSSLPGSFRWCACRKQAAGPGVLHEGAPC